MGDSESKQFGDQFLGKLEGQLDQKAPVFNKSLFVGAGDATRNAWTQGTNFASGLNASGGLTDPMRSAMASFGSIGSGYGAAGDRARNSLSPIAGGYGDAVDDSDASFGSIYSGYGGFRQNGGLNTAQSSAMSKVGGLGSAYGDLADAYGQDAPGYQRMRQQLLDDAVTNVGRDFAASGRSGGGSYIDQATESSLNAIAPLDYQNFQNDVNNRYRSLDSQRGIYGDQFNMAQTGRGNEALGLSGQAGAAGAMFGNRMAGLGGEADIASRIFGTDTAALAGRQGAASSLFGAGQQGLTNQQGAIDALGQIGAAQDANAQGRRLGAADLFDRKHNAELDRLTKIGAAFGDPIAAANQPNWLQQGLGYVLGNAGQAARVGFGG